jgi:hypothetical protein
MAPRFLREFQKFYEERSRSGRGRFRWSPGSDLEAGYFWKSHFSLYMIKRDVSRMTLRVEMSKNGDTAGGARTLSGSYRVGGEKLSYKVTINGPTRAEAAQVLSQKRNGSAQKITRDASTGAFVMKPQGAKRLGVGKRS